MDFTTIFSEFVRMKSKVQFLMTVKYSLQINSVLLLPKMLPLTVSADVLLAAAHSDATCYILYRVLLLLLVGDFAVGFGNGNAYNCVAVVYC